MPPLLHPTLRLTSSLAALLFAALAHADSLDGTWKASALRVSWSVGDWGNDCGPRPSGGGEKGGAVTLQAQGAGFTLSGLGRTYSSKTCWEQMPGLTPRQHSAGKSAIQTTCTMPPGDPRHAKVITSWYPQGDTIVFDEVGQYSFAVAGSTCTASVRRTRTLTRVVTPDPSASAAPKVAAATTKAAPPAGTQSAPEPSTAPTSDTSSKLSSYLRTTLSDAPPPPERSTKCDRPGPPARLEVTPRTKLMRPGESFQFVAVARDAHGCRVPVSTSFRLLGTTDAQLSPTGTLTIPPDARGGHVELEATVGAQSVKVGARIVSAEEFERLLEGGTYGTHGDSLDGAEIALATGHVELDAPPSSPQSKGRWGLLSALFIAMAGVALLLVRHLRRVPARHSLPHPPAQPPRDSVLTEAKSAVPPTSSHPPPSPPQAVTRLCPVCGQRYDGATVFCPDDGARLMRAN